MHSHRRSALGIPSVKVGPLSGPDEQLQLELYDTDTPLLRTDRLRPASFDPPPQPELYRPRLPHYQPPPTNDYSADLNLAELLMSDTDDSLGSAGLGHLTLSSIIPMRTQQPGAKFANAPSRAHNRASTSRFDMRFASRAVHMHSTPSMPSLSWSSSSSDSSPTTTSARLSVDQVSNTDQPLSQPERDTQNPTHEPPSPPTPKARPGPAETKASSASNATTKRSARTTRRSPAPRRQECTTCGKRFQRPCQLVTHIRSHTGEQPHACPVCARRFSVLSNCQRHVKLCQKRSAKVPNPNEEESTNDSAANGAPFIQFSNDPANASQPAPIAEPAARRSHEIPIRPKLASRGSGSTNSSVGGSTAAAEARQRHKTRSGSSSSVGSLAPKSEPPSLERRGSGSSVPVVPSSPAYPQGSYPASSGYSQPSTYGSYSQGGYDLSGSTYNAYGGGYGGSSSGYDQVAAAFEQTSATPGFEQARTAAYDSLNPSFSTTSSGYERSVPAYGGSSPSFDHPELGFNHQYPAAVGTPHVRSLPSPSHVQSTPHSTASPTAATHEAGSYFASTSGVYAAPSARRPSVTSSVTSHLSTIAHSLVQPDQIGFHDARVTDTPTMGSTNDAAGPSVTASGSYYSPNSGLVAVPYETQSMKQEEAVPDLAHRVWPKEPIPYQTGYSEPQWTPAVGAEPSSFHAYHTGSTSSTDLTGPHDNHVASAPTGYAVYPEQQPQQPQSRQQLYHQQAQGGYPNSPGPQQQQAQQHDAYSNSAYAHRSTAYGINSGVVSVPRQSHPDSSNYSWPGSEAAWNTQPGYRS